MHACQSEVFIYRFILCIQSRTASGTENFEKIHEPATLAMVSTLAEN